MEQILKSDAIRTVHVVPESLGEFQSLYLDREINWLRPNLTFVTRDGAPFFQTNEIGLKGDALDPRRKLAVVWGDSVVFGIGRGWPAMLDDYFPEYQFLNGGIEGNVYCQVLKRAVKLNQQRPISINLLLVGWHHVGNNVTLRQDLISALESMRNPVLVTMPTSLNCDIVEQDLSAFFGRGDAEVGFYFMVGMEYSVQQQISLWKHIMDRNDIICDAARDMGVPVIDLFTALDSRTLADFRGYFFDMAHPRPSAYPKIAQAVAAGLKDLMDTGWEYFPPRPDSMSDRPRTWRWMETVRQALSRRARFSRRASIE